MRTRKDFAANVLTLVPVIATEISIKSQGMRPQELSNSLRVSALLKDHEKNIPMALIIKNLSIGISKVLLSSLKRGLCQKEANHLPTIHVQGFFLPLVSGIVFSDQSQNLVFVLFWLSYFLNG